MKILQAVTGWLCTFLGGAQDKLTVRESALKTMGLLGGGSGTSGNQKKGDQANKKPQVIKMVGGGTKYMNLGQFCRCETRVLNDKVFLFRTNIND